MRIEMNKLDRDEIEINIKSIIKRCITEGKILVLIFAILFSVLLPALVYVRDLKEYNNLLSQQGSENEIVLSSEEQVKVDNYLLLNKRYSFIEEYQKNSTVLKLDVSNVCKAELQFYVDAEESIKSELARILVNYVKQNSFEKEFLGVLPENMAKYAYELIDAGTYDESGIVTVAVLASSKEECELYVDVVKGYINDVSEQLQEKMGHHTIIWVQDEYRCGYDGDVYIRQESFYKTTQDVNKQINESRKNLNEVQQKYIQSLESDVENSVDPVKPTISVKFIVIGAILGIGAGFAIVALFVLFGGKVQSEVEIEKRLQIPYLGSLNNKNNQIGMICVHIQAMLKNNDINSVGLIGLKASEKSESLMNLKNQLKEKGIECNIIGNILGDQESLEKASKAGAVIFVETIGKTSIEDIYNEAKICKDLGVEVEGYLMF